MTNLEQLRAKNAFAFMTKQKEKGHKKREKIGQIAKKLPVLFQSNGLLAGAAYLFSQRKKRAEGDEYHIFLANIHDHLKNEAFSFGLIGADLQDVFTEQWLDKGFGTAPMRDITKEIVAYSGWLKRAAETFLQD